MNEFSIPTKDTREIKVILEGHWPGWPICKICRMFWCLGITN